MAIFHCYVSSPEGIHWGCPKYLFPDSPQSLSQSRSNRGTTVSNRGRVCSSLIRSYTQNIGYVLYNEDPCVNAFDFKFGNKISSHGPETVWKTHSSTSSSSTSSTSSTGSSRSSSSRSSSSSRRGKSKSRSRSRNRRRSSSSRAREEREREGKREREREGGGNRWLRLTGF